MRGWRLATWVVLGIVTVAVACNDYDDASPMDADAGPDGGPSGDGSAASNDATAADAGSETGSDAGTGPFLWAVHGEMVSNQPSPPFALAATEERVAIGFSSNSSVTMQLRSGPVDLAGPGVVYLVLHQGGAFLQNGILPMAGARAAAIDSALESYFGGYGNPGGGKPVARLAKPKKDAGAFWTNTFDQADATIDTSTATGIATRNLDIATALYFRGEIDVPLKGSAGSLRLQANDYDSVIDVVDSVNGRAFWTKVIGGPGAQMAQVLSYDADGNLLVAGDTDERSVFVGDAGVDGGETSGNLAPFFVRVSANEPHDVISGAVLPIAAFDGTDTFATVLGARALSKGDVVLCGVTRNVTRLGDQDVARKGGSDAFVLRASPSGKIAWLKVFGGTETDTCTSLAIDSHDDVIVGVTYQSSTVSIDGVMLAPPNDSRDSAGAVLKLDADGHLVWHYELTRGSARVVVVATTPNDDVLYGGYFAGKIDLGDGERSAGDGGSGPFLVRRGR